MDAAARPYDPHRTSRRPRGAGATATRGPATPTASSRRGRSRRRSTSASSRRRASRPSSRTGPRATPSTRRSSGTSSATSPRSRGSWERILLQVPPVVRPHQATGPSQGRLGDVARGRRARAPRLRVHGLPTVRNHRLRERHAERRPRKIPSRLPEDTAPGGSSHRRDKPQVDLCDCHLFLSVE